MFSKINPFFNYLNSKFIAFFIILSLITGIFAYKTYSIDYYLNLNIQSLQADQIKLYFDKNKTGYNEKNTIYLYVVGDGKFHNYSFKIPGGNYGPHRIRVFIAGSEPFKINRADITNAQGKQIIEYPITNITSLMDVKLTYKEPNLIVEKVPGAKDPNILLNAENTILPLNKQTRILFTVKTIVLTFFILLFLAYAQFNNKSIEQFLTENKRAFDSLFYVVLVLFFTSMWLMQVQPFIEDDGAFFLQYAVNIAHGAFWKYNLQDSLPVWGASAPLWPLVIAFFIKIGFSSIAAIHLASYVCAISFTLISALVLDKKFGKHAAFLFILFVSLDGRLQHYFSSGLESPLTALLISLLFAVTLEVITSNIAFAIIIGLLAVQKIDLIPLACVGYMLHIYYKGFDKRVLAIALLIPLIWYGFAWIYFGFPIPNSFLTKALHQNSMPVTTKTTWFIDFLTVRGWNWTCWSLCIYVFLLSSLICLFYKKYRFFLLSFTSLIIIHLTAYTLKRPFEPYSWYVIPSIIASLFISVVGISLIINKAKFKSISFLMTLILAVVFFKERWPAYSDFSYYMNKIAYHQDADRARAGMWVNRNIKENATVYTGWGLPGYYAHRYIYDFSFLNRKYEEVDLISKYKPDVLIHQGYISGNMKTAQCNNPGLFDPHNDYHIIKTFTSHFNNTGADYCFFVAIRDRKVLLNT